MGGSTEMTGQELELELGLELTSSSN